MSDHSTALVPIETWLYASPDLREREIAVDIGLLAEALVYYDKLFVNVSNASQLASLINWFVQRNQLALFISLIQDGTINFYHYAFFTSPFVDGFYHKLININDSKMDEPNSFEKLMLESQDTIKAFESRLLYEQFCRATEGRVIEVKAEKFGTAITNAEDDFVNPSRAASLIQALLDEMFAVKKLGEVPEIKCEAVFSKHGEIHLDWKINLDPIAKSIGLHELDTRYRAGNALTSTALAGAGMANRFLLTASQEGVDLYLPRPISLVVGDKLYEALTEETVKTQTIIDTLQERVEFPDLRELVNRGEIHIDEVLLFRRKGNKFRQWLQNEAERDRDAFFAYHNEVAKEAGYIRNTKKLLSIFGKLGGGAIGSLIGTSISGNPNLGGAVGALAGDGLSFLTELASKYGEWKPVVFGDWYTNRVSGIVEARAFHGKLLTQINIQREKEKAERRHLRRARLRAKQKRRGKE